MTQKQEKGLTQFVDTNKELLIAFLKKLLSQSSSESSDEESGTPSDSQSGGSTDSSTNLQEYKKIDWDPVVITKDKISETLKKYNQTFQGLINNVTVLKNNKLDAIQMVEKESSQEQDNETKDTRSLTIVSNITPSQTKTATYIAEKQTINLPPEKINLEDPLTIEMTEEGYINLPPLAYFKPQIKQDETQEYNFSTISALPIKINLTSMQQRLNSISGVTLIIPFKDISITDLDQSYVNKFPEVRGAENVRWYHQSLNVNDGMPTTQYIQDEESYYNVRAYTGAKYNISVEVFATTGNGSVDLTEPPIYIAPTTQTDKLFGEEAAIIIKNHDIIKPNRNYVIRLGFKPSTTNIMSNDGHEIILNPQEEEGKFWCFIPVRTLWGEQYLSASFKGEGSSKSNIIQTNLSFLMGEKNGLTWQSQLGFNQEKSNSSLYINNQGILYFQAPAIKERSDSGDWTRNNKTDQNPNEYSGVRWGGYKYEYAGGLVSSIFNRSSLEQKKLEIKIRNLAISASNLKMRLLLMFAQGQRRFDIPSKINNYHYARNTYIQYGKHSGDTWQITGRDWLDPTYNFKNGCPQQDGASTIWTTIDLKPGVDTYVVSPDKFRSFSLKSDVTTSDLNYGDPFMTTTEVSDWFGSGGTCYLSVSLIPQGFWNNFSAASAQCTITSIKIINN